MARVTIEDCIAQEENKFNLVTLAALRTHTLLSGSPPKVERDQDKWPVVALREIAAGFVDHTLANDAEYLALMEEFRSKARKQDELISGLGIVDNL